MDKCINLLQMRKGKLRGGQKILVSRFREEKARGFMLRENNFI
jgi:hypothetical protein